MNRRRELYLCLALALGTLAVFWPAVYHDFINYDDDLYVTEKPLVQRGLTLEGILWAFTNFEACNWHPVTWLSHMLDCTLFQVFPGGHHLTNLVLHALNVVLLFLLLQRMTGAAWRSAIVAALFAWHPLHVESVAWIAERKDLLSTLFMILTLWAYVRYVEKPGVLRYVWILIWYALGLMSKAMLVTLPLLLVLLDYWPLGRLRWPSSQKAELDPAWSLRLAPGLDTLVLEKIPLFVMAVAVGLVTLRAQEQGGAIQSLDALSPGSRLANALTAYAAYLGKTFWPTHLAIPYPLHQHLAFGTVFLSTVILGGITAVVLRGLHRTPYLAVGWFWYLVTLVPVIGLIQVGGQAMADRYTYIPLIGVFLALVWAADAWSARWKVSLATEGAAALAVLFTCAVCSRGQLLYWRDSVALFQNTVRVTRNNLGAHNNLGAALSGQGRSNEAIAHFLAALRIQPTFVKARYNLSLEYLNQGQVTQAMTQLRETLYLKPGDAPAHNNLGVLLARQGRYDEAISHYVTAVKLQPAYAKAHMNLADALAKQGRIGDALRHFRVVSIFAPDSPEALAAYAHALATAPDKQLRNGPRAVELAERACELSQYSCLEYLNTLTAAYAEAGRQADAVATAQKALRLAETMSQESPDVQRRESPEHPPTNKSTNSPP